MDRVAVARRFYKSFIAHDWDAVRSTFDDRAELGFSGRNPFAGHHVGAERCVAVLRDTGDRSEDTLRPVLDDSSDICASDHHVIAFDWFRAQRGQDEMKAYLYFVMAIEHEKIVRMFVHSSEQYEFDEFWT